MSGCPRERGNDWGEILGGLALVGLPSPSTDIPSSILLVLMSAQKITTFAIQNMARAG